jgi:hypothetical protein
MKNIRLIIILFTLVVAAFAVHMLLQKKERINSTKENENDFAVLQMSLIDRITVKTPEGNLATLSKDKEADKWTLNGSIAADPDQIKNFFILLNQLKVQREASQAVADSLRKNLPDKGYEVNVYGAGKALKSYYFGGYAPDKSGNYALLKGGNQPFIVALPGYELDLSGIFNITSTEWKDRYLFSSSLRSIKKISIDFPKRPSSSYGITYSSKKFLVDGVSKLDSSYLGDYLSMYSRIKVTKFVENPTVSFQDSLKKAVPDFILSLDDIDSSRSNLIKLYFILSKGELPNKNSLLYGYIPNRNEIALVKWKNFQYLAVPKSEFEKKEAKKDLPF